MIRPFQLQDIGLLQRLRHQGLPLNAELALIQRAQPVVTALRYIVLGGNRPTFVWRADEGSAAGFVQLRLNDSGTHAHLVYLGSAESNNPNPVDSNHWLPLIDQVVAMGGQQGVQTFIADVGENGPELPIFRRAGFAVYTRQDIWVRNQPLASSGQTQLLQDKTTDDDWHIQKLYAHTVPRMIKMVEPDPPLNGGIGKVLRENDELTAYVHLRKGNEANWLRLLFHPNGQGKATDVVKNALQLRPPSQTQPIYCSLRRYQQWLQGALQDNGFEYWGSQALMVKHTVLHKKPTRVKHALPTIEHGQSPAQTAPVSQPGQHASKINDTQVKINARR